jgi:hypothetical protein
MTTGLVEFCILTLHATLKGFLEREIKPCNIHCSKNKKLNASIFQVHTRRITLVMKDYGIA